MTDLNKEREAFEASEYVKTIIHKFEWSEEFKNYQIKDCVINGNIFDLLEAKNDEQLLNGAWFGWQEKAKAQAVPEKKIYLTCEQLYAAANFGAPNKDPELLETELTIAWFDEAHSGSGYYVYISEYPEEGAMKLESESGAEG
ncbi:hypothetical protein A1D06_10670 [Acinetobacter baumannii]|uniref:hypothetical protein n=1 Tax=Acinetobacter baumannii TaxID=470 RepID=UPI0007D89813|nr:hypothetical protein [Acinetobacter baumannii]OFD23831.1 hypothetical protein A1D06_10670 [Acinetobacter baumannii]